MAREHEVSKGALSKEDKTEEEHSGKHEVHVRKLDHGYHVTKKHPDGSETEHAAGDLDEVHDHLHQHMLEAEQQAAMESEGQPNPEGEPEGEGQPQEEPEQQ